MKYTEQEYLELEEKSLEKHEFYKGEILQWREHQYPIIKLFAMH